MGDVDISCRSPTECPLCYESYSQEGEYQPRMIIPCGHTVCYTCINRLAQQPVMMCPICRKKCPSRLINEGGFPINYLAITLLESQKKDRVSTLQANGGGGDSNASRCSSNSDVTCKSPKLGRAKSLNKDNSKGGNVCSECKKTTDRLSYCFHCASAVCEDCRSQHTEGVVKDLEKQNNTLQEQKRLMVKKIEAVQRMISTLDDNCAETENDIDDNFTIIQHEVSEAKSRLVDSLNQKFSKEKQRLQNHCETLTDALEKAGSCELPEIMDKNIKDITGNEIALLCEQAMDLLVSSRNLRFATKSVKMRHCSFNFAHGEKLATIRTALQKFGSIKVQTRQPKPEQWDPEDDEISDGGDGVGAGSRVDSLSGILSNSASLEDGLSEGEEDDSIVNGRRNAKGGSNRRRGTTTTTDRGDSDDSVSDKDDAALGRPLDRYAQRSASVFLPATSPGRAKSYIGSSSSYGAGSGGGGSSASKSSGGGVKSKVRNKLVKQQSGNDKILRASSLGRLDTFSDDGMSDVSRKNSVSGGGSLIEQHNTPPVQNYATLRDKYEAIRGPVSSLIYRDSPSKGHVLDVVARYRSSGFVVADNNEYQIRAFNSNYHLSAHFSFRLGEEDVPFISGIAATSDKIFLLVDSKNKYVRVFDRKGSFIREIGKDLFQRPKDVCTDDVEIFVTDSGASCIQVFDMQGKHLRTLGGPGSADGEFLWPAGMKMTTEGKLVVCDCNNNRIQYLTKDGEHIQNISSIYGTYSALRPTCVDLDRENNVVVLFSESRRVKIYNKDLNVMHDFRVDDELNSVAVTSDGLIALVDGSKSGKCFIY